MTGEATVLRALRLDTVLTPDSVWGPGIHVPGMQREAEDRLARGMDDAYFPIQHGSTSSPRGVVLAGRKGVGKTHLLGWIRETVLSGSGYFFLVAVDAGVGFWPSVLGGIRDGLTRRVDESNDQLSRLLHRLGREFHVDQELEKVLDRSLPPLRRHLDDFVARARRHDRQLGLEAQSTLRALVLLNSDDSGASDAGSAYFSPRAELEEEERRRYNLRGHRSPREIVQDLSRILAATHQATVLAFDQIDGLLAGEAGDVAAPVGGPTADRLANDLMDVREITRSTLVVLTCLPTAWETLARNSVSTLVDRFEVVWLRDTVPDEDLARHLVREHLRPLFKEVGFVPPDRSWPLSDAALREARQVTARRLLDAVQDHLLDCAATGDLRPMGTLDRVRPETEIDPVPRRGQGSQSVVDELDARFGRELEEANPSVFVDQATEDLVVPAVLAGALGALVEENRGDGGPLLLVDPAPRGRSRAWHARLRLVLDPETEREAHWTFRALAATHPRSVIGRLRTAEEAAGLPGRDRRLLLLRQTAWPHGPKTASTVADVESVGASTFRVPEDDLRVIVALAALVEENPPGLRAWLRQRRPASGTDLFGGVLSEARDLTGPPERSTAAKDDPASVEGTEPEPEPRALPDALVLGRFVPEGEAGRVALDALRMHAVVFAGSGSGKTVLLRRIVEEAALQGVSSIVLDVNNDLSRLGDAWPVRPGGWLPGDDARAARYLDRTEVVVWTPGRSGGRPLSLQPLPDFASVLDNPDEFREAVDAAVDALAPRAKLEGAARHVQPSRAVLRQAVERYARDGLTGLDDLIDLLRFLPDDLSLINKAPRLAADLADMLYSATVNDPLFGGAGVAMDPGVLLTPGSGFDARISVISFVGLPSDEQRQGFVGQLQMALFAWIKRHPAVDRPLAGLLVMDEAQTYAPSERNSPCTASTLALASQARKYGLGLLYATQAPKSLHNRIPGNAATQFFGLLNSPIQIETARELAKVKGGDVPDIGRLKVGQFYLADTGSAFRRLDAALCLTHHPQQPLTPEEVLGRARGSAGEPGA